MTDNKTDSAQLLPQQLRSAKARSLRLRKLVFREIEASKHSPGSAPVQKVLVAVREYSAALINVTNLEAEIEEHSYAIRGVVQGDAVDLDAARREVLDRIARFRERSGG